MTAPRFHSVAEARAAARRRVPLALFDYIDGAAEDERTAARNLAAFGEVTFVPRAGGAVREPRLGTSVLGLPMSMPVVLAPCGLVEIMHPDGTAAVVRAAHHRELVCTISTVAGVSAREAAVGAGGPLWFQLYSSSRAQTEELVAAAAQAGYQGLVVTMDTPALGNRERDTRNGVSLPPRLRPGNALRLASQVAVRPAWAAGVARAQVRKRRAAAGGLAAEAPAGGGVAPATPAGPGAAAGGPEAPAGSHGVAAGPAASMGVSASPFSWEDIATIRRLWRGPLLVKGLMTAADTKLAVGAGVDGVIVSNHGGRQLEDAPATLSVVPSVVAAAGEAPVLVDGGVRRGADVVKAVALGAAGVLVGRAYLYGLAAAGQAGVERVLGILRADMIRTLTLLGCEGVDVLDRSWVTVPSSWPS